MRHKLSFGAGILYFTADSQGNLHLGQNNIRILCTNNKKPCGLILQTMIEQDWICSSFLHSQKAVILVLLLVPCWPVQVCCSGIWWLSNEFCLRVLGWNVGGGDTELRGDSSTIKLNGDQGANSWILVYPCLYCCLLGFHRFLGTLGVGPRLLFLYEQDVLISCISPRSMKA